MGETPQTPKSLKAQITRASLVLAAAALLREEGPSAVTYRRVAKWAGAASSSVGYYFDSVTELLQEAGQHNIQMWAQRAERAALAAEQLSPTDCRKQCVDLLIKACLPEDSTVPSAHYAQLIAAADSDVVTQAYKKGRVALDAAIERILSRAEVSMTPRLVVAIVDGAAVAAISEGYDVHEMATNLLAEVVANY
ncbi:MAG: TetR family transcriptional regulator, partial [Raoultibacter sp.]